MKAHCISYYDYGHHKPARWWTVDEIKAKRVSDRLTKRQVKHRTFTVDLSARSARGLPMIERKEA